MIRLTSDFYLDVNRSVNWAKTNTWATEQWTYNIMLIYGDNQCSYINISSWQSNKSNVFSCMCYYWESRLEIGELPFLTNLYRTDESCCRQFIKYICLYMFIMSNISLTNENNLISMIICTVRLVVTPQSNIMTDTPQPDQYDGALVPLWQCKTILSRLSAIIPLFLGLLCRGGSR